MTATNASVYHQKRVVYVPMICVILVWMYAIHAKGRFVPNIPVIVVFVSLLHVKIVSMNVANVV